MAEYLNNEQVNDLIVKSREGNNRTWEDLCKNFEAYIASRVQEKKMEKDYLASKDEYYMQDLTKELMEAGWLGFVNAVKNYKTDRGTIFLTYASYYIDGEISRELNIQLNPLGIKDRPKIRYDKNGNATGVIRPVPLEEWIDSEEAAEEIFKSFLSF